MIKSNKRHGRWDYQRFGKLRHHCVLEDTLETQDHVATALGGPFAREQYGGRAPHGLSVANDPRKFSRPGRAEGRTEAARPPGPLAPWPALWGGGSRAAASPPPPRRRQAAPVVRGCPTTLTQLVHLGGMRRRRKWDWAEGRRPPPPGRWGSTA